MSLLEHCFAFESAFLIILRGLTPHFVSFPKGFGPDKVSIVDPKGMVGFAVCDMLRVTLTQSADQMSTGTCSYVASLAALIRDLYNI